jgi:predicted metal-binding transcription factor (methanogenesis marker protein 9)
MKKETKYIVRDAFEVSREEYIKRKELLYIELIDITQKDAEKVKKAYEKKLKKIQDEILRYNTRLEYLQNMKKDEDLKPLF